MEREYRMYGLVPYNISPIQQGIQFGHAVVEYSNNFFDEPEYQKWATADKTFIILNGGTTNMRTDRPGSLNKAQSTLIENGIKIGHFYEPDLGDQLTAVVFLVDDRTWDKENWPDYSMPFEDVQYFKEKKRIGRDPQAVLESLDSWEEWKAQFSNDETEASAIVWMRDFLKKFRLA